MSTILGGAAVGVLCAVSGLVGYRLGSHRGVRWTLDQMQGSPGYEAVYLHTLARMRAASMPREER